VVLSNGTLFSKKSGGIKERTQHHLSTKLADAHFGALIRQLANFARGKFVHVTVQ